MRVHDLRRRWAAAVAIVLVASVVVTAGLHGRGRPDDRPRQVAAATAATEEAAALPVAAPAAALPVAAPAAPLPVAAPAAPGGADISGPATGPFAPAVDLGPPIDPACEPPAGVPASAGQVVVVTATSPSSSLAEVDLLVKTGGSWRCELRDVPARVGRNGVRPLAARRSGDGTTPSGIFPLGTAVAPDGQSFEFFGNGADPGVHGAWRQVRSGDCWVATPNTAAYNSLVSRSPGACTSPDEYLPSITGAYSVAALIGANMGPDRSGDAPGEPPLAAAIFLHRFSYDGNGAPRATSGCVSLAAGDLATVVTALRPGQAWFAIGG